jgi:flagellar hook-associated protein 3 FlgL
MSGRVTNSMISRSVLADLNEVSQRLAKTQRKMSSGKEITRPSDDPYGASRALTMRGSLESSRQYQRNVGEAIGWQDVTDVALSKMSDTVLRVRELVIQGSSDSAGKTAREALAAEIDQLVESLKQEANASYSGRYVFSGTDTDVRPYTVGGPDTFAGNTSPVAREIGPGVSVQVNVVAKDILGDGQGPPGDSLLLDVLRDVTQHLRGGTVTDLNALRTTDLKALSTNLDDLSKVRATVGATTNRLETADARLQEVEASTTKLLSDVEDADMAKTMVDYSMQQSIYQSALHSGANIVQASLLDFLR